MAAVGVAAIDVRSPAVGVCILDIQGELTASAEEPILAALSLAGRGARTVVLNLSAVESMDSHGAGVLIAVQARTQRQKQRLLAYGLSQECRRAFQATHLDERVGLCSDEADALRSLQGSTRLLRTPPSPPEAPMPESQAMHAMQQPAKWIRPPDRLSIPPVPKGAISANSEGRRPTGPVKGFGRLWRRTYAIRLVGATVTPAEVVRIWKERFGSFWPPSGRFYGGDKPIEAGDVAVLNLAGPAGLTIATGILVIYADDESFSFLSAQGHMFGGMITFSAHTEDGVTVAQVQALLRASDPLFEIASRLGLTTRPEDQFWQGALSTLAAHLGVVGQPVRQRAVLLDRRLQWPEARNVWYNGAIRNALYMPVWWLRRLGAR
jgi:anti-anti-sigma factor